MSRSRCSASANSVVHPALPGRQKQNSTNFSSCSRGRTRVSLFRFRFHVPRLGITRSQIQRWAAVCLPQAAPVSGSGPVLSQLLMPRPASIPDDVDVLAQLPHARMAAVIPLA